MVTSRCVIGWALLCSLALPQPLFAQATPPNLTGKWTGTLINLPLRSGAPTIDVTIEIGPMPAADNTCTPWKTTYSEAGVVKQVKDYQFCRGTGPDDLYTDEGGGVKLAARWVGDVLVSPFKVGNLLLIVETRVRGDVLEEEIFTIDDQPAIAGILPLKARSIQRLTLRRAESTLGLSGSSRTTPSRRTCIWTPWCS